jgi:hypothetical protein
MELLLCNSGSLLARGGRSSVCGRTPEPKLGGPGFQLGGFPCGLIAHNLRPRCTFLRTQAVHTAAGLKLELWLFCFGTKIPARIAFILLVNTWLGCVHCILQFCM